MIKKPTVLVVAVALCALVALAFGGAVWATNPSPSPTSTSAGQQAVPTPTPDPPLTPAEFEEFADSVCGNVEISVSAIDHDHNRLWLEWFATDYDGPHRGPRYDGELYT